MKKLLLLLIIPLVALISLPARAAVVDSCAAGFTVKYEVTIAAVPDTVYKRMLAITNWWDDSHTFSGKSANLVLQDKANGCFCERIPPGGSARHMNVINAEPGKIFRLSGALGPLQAYAVTGIMTFQFQQTDTGTRLSMTYTVGGYVPSGISRFAPLVDQVLVQQLDRLKVYAEGK